MPPDKILKDIVENEVKTQKLSDDALDWLDDFEDWVKKPTKLNGLNKYDLKTKKEQQMKVMRLERYSFDPKKDCSKQDWYGERRNSFRDDQTKAATGFSIDINAKSQHHYKSGSNTKANPFI